MKIDLKQDLEELFTDFKWSIKGMIDIDEKLHEIPKNATCITAIVEQLAIEKIKELASRYNSTLTLADNTRQYPDITLSKGVFGNKNIAIDVKTTRRISTTRISGFTVGSYAGYFKNPTIKKPGCRLPYEQFHEHWILGFIYDWDDTQDTLNMVSNIELIVQPKWKIASKTTGTGTTKHMGSIKLISDLKEGNSIFKTKKEFEEYWRAYGST